MRRSHLGATPRLPSAHGAPPFHGCWHECSKPPGCGCPGPHGRQGQGRAKPGVPGEQGVFSVSEGFTEGSPRAPPPRAVSPGHTASSPWQPQAASHVGGPAGRAVQTGDGASPVRQTENRTSACQSGASPRQLSQRCLPSTGVGASTVLTWTAQPSSPASPHVGPDQTQSGLFTVRPWLSTPAPPG